MRLSLPSPRLALLVFVLALPLAATPLAPAAPQTTPAERQPYLGTWQREVTDGTGSTRITLELRNDGNYTKNLDASLKGKTFHGAEQGSWAANGPLVLLSGDAKSAPSRHDLRNYKKVR